jgi:hypothetical protein
VFLPQGVFTVLAMSTISKGVFTVLAMSTISKGVFTVLAMSTISKRSETKLRSWHFFNIKTKRTWRIAKILKIEAKRTLHIQELTKTTQGTKKN